MLVMYPDDVDSVLRDVIVPPALQANAKDRSRRSSPQTQASLTIYLLCLMFKEAVILLRLSYWQLDIRFRDGVLF